MFLETKCTKITKWRKTRCREATNISRWATTKTKEEVAEDTSREATTEATTEGAKDTKIEEKVATREATEVKDIRVEIEEDRAIKVAIVEVKASTNSRTVSMSSSSKLPSRLSNLRNLRLRSTK